MHFRAPDERTGEYQPEMEVLRNGTFINVKQEKGTNAKGYSLPQAHRFGGIMNFHDKGTGQTVFCGPNSYNAGEAAVKLMKQASPFIQVSLC